MGVNRLIVLDTNPLRASIENDWIIKKELLHGGLHGGWIAWGIDAWAWDWDCMGGCLGGELHGGLHGGLNGWGRGR